MTCIHWRTATSAAFAILTILPSAAHAGDAPDGVGGATRDPLVVEDQDLTRLSLEELAMVEVTSVSRRPEALADAAAAVYVISADDIRRSGATSLPEVLRLAPNLNVQRINAADYAISARGFNGYETSNKLLVLIDGRSIYSTLSSGVFWDARDLMLDDIERIEVVSGPGGALYGSNAMNGVINITTRSARDTLGTLARIGVGNEDSVLSLRHGGALSGDAAWRAYVTGFTRDDSFAPAGGDATDATEGVRAGARMDWASGPNRLTLQGDVFSNQVTINEDFSGVGGRVGGGNVVGRWSRDLGGGELQVQAFYDRFERTEPFTREASDTWDLSIQHGTSRGRHQLVWGAGYRTVRSAFRAPPGGSVLDPADRTLTLINLFAQDQIALTEAVTLTAGVKFEDNSFSGQEILPNLRLAWRRPGGDLVWAAVSRASRTPNRIERDLTLPGFLTGGDFQSETLTAYEIGYRANPSPNASFSISTFYNRYDDLRTVSTTPVTLLPLNLTNHGEAETWGVEAWGSYDVSPRWRLSAGVSTLTKRYDATPTLQDISGLVSIGDDPDYQLLFHSRSELTDDLDLDVRLRAVDSLVATGSWVEGDVRLGWRLTDRLELSVIGQNLINDRRLETSDPSRRRAFGRSILAALRVGF